MRIGINKVESRARARRWFLISLLVDPSGGVGSSQSSSPSALIAVVFFKTFFSHARKAGCEAYFHDNLFIFPSFPHSISVSRVLSLKIWVEHEARPTAR
jgi:hypothetical protein